MTLAFDLPESAQQFLKVLDPQSQDIGDLEGSDPEDKPRINYNELKFDPERAQTAAAIKNRPHRTVKFTFPYFYDSR